MNEGSFESNQEEDTDYSENESSKHDYYLMKAVIAATARRRNRRRAPQPMHNSILTGSMRVEEILNGHEEIIQGLISMKLETFRSLSVTNRHISYLFQHSRETTSRWFFKVLQGCICAIDDTHISCVLPVKILMLGLIAKGFTRRTYQQPAIAFHGFPIPAPGENVDVNTDYILDDEIDGPDPIQTEPKWFGTTVQSKLVTEPLYSQLSLCTVAPCSPTCYDSLSSVQPLIQRRENLLGLAMQGMDESNSEQIPRAHPSTPPESQPSARPVSAQPNEGARRSHSGRFVDRPLLAMASVAAPCSPEI
ncbi:hypothetical protein TIFTF001_007106 [Ficus carica]|uniref:Uncharacterized protein n=1 Tax=Ficus carica TaxID=3494 RepID=A0AA87ZSN4_FICCA|nr:hypothetical protein TIFTF001_007106 [Ficus carica]